MSSAQLRLSQRSSSLSAASTSAAVSLCADVT
jgi:hypothetical protein